MSQVLYLTSTPLNILVSCVVAFEQKSIVDQADQRLWLIDQKPDEKNAYLNALLAWEKSPFVDVKLFHSSEKGLSKLQYRKQLLKSLEGHLKDYKPDIIATGSDRRIEFQYLMHLMSDSGECVQGWYLDDGLYSYAGRPSFWFKDGLNNILKKLFYGFWWEEPRTVGSSSLINKTWLFEPKKAVQDFKQKQLRNLNLSWFKSKEIIALSKLIANQLNFELTQLSKVQVILLLPHPNNVEKVQGYKDLVVRNINFLSSKGISVAVKYHPRFNSEDEYKLSNYSNVMLIPSTIAFEFCLPALTKECIVIGDVGTAIFTTKCLRPDIKVHAILDKNDKFQNQFVPLIKSFNIELNESIEGAF